MVKYISYVINMLVSMIEILVFLFYSCMKLVVDRLEDDVAGRRDSCQQPDPNTIYLLSVLWQTNESQASAQRRVHEVTTSNRLSLAELLGAHGD